MVRATGKKMWVWGAVAALTIGMVGIGGPATAAPPSTSSAPLATASATVHEDNTVTITFSINRTVNQVTASCALDDDPIGCDRRPVSVKKLTTYTRNLSELADGLHTFVVTFSLTDGGTASATAEFTIATLAGGCEALSGTLILNPDTGPNGRPIAWGCIGWNYDGPQPAPGGTQADAEAFAVSWGASLAPYCPKLLESVGGYGFDPSGYFWVHIGVACFL